MAAVAAAGGRGVLARVDPLTLLTVLLLLIGITYPFLRIMPEIGSDTQPLALFAAFIILAASRFHSLSKPLVVLAALAAGATVMLLLGTLDLTAVRNWSNYLSLFLIALAVDVAVREDLIPMETMLTGAVLSWFAVGAIQTLWSPQFAYGLLVAARTSEVRGVVGLAPEPTMYALQCLLFALLASLAVPGKRGTWLIGLCVFQIIVFARSTMGVMLLGVWALAHVALSLRTPKRLVVALLAVAGAVILTYFVVLYRVPGLSEGRLAFMVKMAIEDPRYLFFVDISGAQRMSHIVYSFAAFTTDNGMPHGFSAWLESAAALAPRFEGVFYEPPGGFRPMSGYGAALFELGWLGLLAPIAITWALLRFLAAPKAVRIVAAITLNILLLTAIPLATPMIAFIVGYLSAHSGRPSTVPRAAAA